MKVIIIAYAYALIMISEYNFNGAEYYYICSASYAIISLISSIAAYTLKCRILFCYSLVNLFAAIINWFLATPEGYDLFNYFYWYAPLNFSLIFLAVELMLLWSGGRDAFIFIHNEFNSYRGKHNNLKTIVGDVK